MKLVAVKEGLFAGDVAPVDLRWGQARPWGSDVFTDGDREGIQGVALDGMELLPNLG